MVRTKQRVSRHYTEEILVEESSIEEEMATAPVEGSSEEESSTEDMASRKIQRPRRRLCANGEENTPRDG